MEYLPSLACADPLNLERDTAELSSLGFKCLHFDIMDCHYVKNLSLSFDIGKRVKERFPELALDVHAMVDSPEDWVERIADMGASRFAFHLDAAKDAKALVEKSKKLGMGTGVALNPTQSIQELLPVIDEIDFVLMMSITPGFPGVAFIPETYARMEKLMSIRKERGLTFRISVDGGITPDAAKNLTILGADMLVLGYFIMFRQPDSISDAWRRNLPLMQP